MRRSTRASPAATSSTARWRSSTRPCSETAKSTRSRRPPPSSVRCASRTRRTRTTAHHASAAPATPTPTPTIATISASVAVTCTTARLAQPLAEREDDRVGALVVVDVHLALHRSDVDEQVLLLRELDRAQVGEGHRLLLTRVDHRDPQRPRDRRVLLDRQRDRDPDLLEVAGVLDRHDEGEARRRRHG